MSRSRTVFRLLQVFFLDDAPFATRGLSKSKLNKLRKDLGRFIKDFFSINVIFDVNFKVIKFLDVTLQLNTGLFSSFPKPNNRISYINVLFNHSKYIIDGIVKAISIRVSNLSANEDIFNKHARIYNNALRLSSFKNKISYIPNTQFHQTLRSLTIQNL